MHPNFILPSLYFSKLPHLTLLAQIHCSLFPFRKEQAPQEHQSNMESKMQKDQAQTLDKAIQ